MKKQLATVLLAAVTGVSSLSSALIVYEGFDYSSGQDLDGLSGGAPSGSPGWNGSTWTDLNDPNGQTFDTVGTSLSYSGLTTTGGAVIEDQQNDSTINSSSYRRSYDLTGTGFGANGTDAWISYLVDVSGSGSHGFAWGSPAGNLTQLQLYRINIGGVSDNTWRLQIGGNTDDLVNADGISASGLTFILMKVDFESGADDTSVWFNPNIASITTEADLGTPDLFLDTNGVSANDTITFTAGNFPSSVTYDEFRLTTTLEEAFSAVPEPSSYALISGFLALSWMVVRRRR